MALVKPKYNPRVVPPGAQSATNIPGQSGIKPAPPMPPGINPHGGGVNDRFGMPPVQYRPDAPNPPPLNGGAFGNFRPPPMNGIGQGLPPGDTGNPPNPPPAPTPEQPRFDRSQESFADRLVRLRALPGDTEKRRGNIDELKVKIAAGKIGGPKYVPPGTTPPPGTPPPTPNPNPVQLDNDPSTWNQRDAAEYAPPIGSYTYFRDTETPATGNNQGGGNNGNNNGGAGGSNDGGNNNGNNNNNGGGGTPGTPAGTSYDSGANDASIIQLTQRLDNLNKKLASGQGDQKQLKQRIMEVQRQLDRLKTTPQPGTPMRPYRTHQVTYNPVGYGGTLRV